MNVEQRWSAAGREWRLWSIGAAEQRANGTWVTLRLEELDEGKSVEIAEQELRLVPSKVDGARVSAALQAWSAALPQITELARRESEGAVMPHDVVLVAAALEDPGLQSKQDFEEAFADGWRLREWRYWPAAEGDYAGRLE